MKLPEIVRRIGQTDGEIRVYVEDYVYTYLEELRKKKDILPLRAALFGHVIHKDNLCYYLVYGACCVVEELEYGQGEEQIRERFFEDLDLIGYVNISRDKRVMAEKSNGYFVFYEANEAMKAYLLYCYQREKRRSSSRQELLEGFPPKCSLGKKKKFLGDIVKQFLCVMCILLLATVISAIGDYEKLYGFAEMTDRAVCMMETGK